MKTAEELKQNINAIKRQIDDLSFEKAKLELKLEDIEPSEYIDHCCVCGCSSKEKKINIHSAINMPVSLSYCEDCDSKGYITLWEVLIYLANSNHKNHILKDWDFIRENIETIIKADFKHKINVYDQLNQINKYYNEEINE